MQNSVFSKINVYTRILSLILLVLSLFIAKSLYLIIFFTIFLIILLLLTNKSVKCYIYSLKNVKFWLLFLFITYIIVFRNILDSFVFIYKLLLIVMFVKQFSMTVNVTGLINGFKTILKPLKNINTDSVSYNLVLGICFINVYMNSKKHIFSKYGVNQKLLYTFSLKYNVLPRLFYTTFYLNKIESSLKLKFYKPNYEQTNLESKIVLSLSCLLFILVFFKEVII